MKYDPTKTVMPYGQHAGIPICDLPTCYLRWLHTKCRDECGRSSLPGKVAAAVAAEVLRRDGEQATAAPPPKAPKAPKAKRERTPESDHDTGNVATPPACKAFLQAEMSLGEWVPVRRTWARTFGVRSATVLAAIVSLGRVRADADGWTAVDSLLSDHLGLADSVIESVLAKLAERSVIERRSVKGRRLVRPLLDRISTEVS